MQINIRNYRNHALDKNVWNNYQGGINHIGIGLYINGGQTMVGTADSKMLYRSAKSNKGSFEPIPSLLLYPTLSYSKIKN